MPLQKFAREWRDVYANEIARAVYEGRKPDPHALNAWARYDAASRSDSPFGAHQATTDEGTPDAAHP